MKENNIEPISAKPIVFHNLPRRIKVNPWLTAYAETLPKPKKK